MKITIEVSNKELDALEDILTTGSLSKYEKRVYTNMSLELWGRMCRAYDKGLKKTRSFKK